MKEYIGVDLGKRKAVVVKKIVGGTSPAKQTLAVSQAALESYFSKQNSKRFRSSGSHREMDVFVRDHREVHTRSAIIPTTLAAKYKAKI
jgi:hypothetical protein